jgi:toxin ParE1/3/4
MRLVWTKAAIEDLSDICDYIMRDRPDAAKQVASKILQQVESLVDNPHIGRKGRIAGTRELVIGRYPYSIPYRVHEEEIQLLRVLHDRRNWPGK